MRKSLHIALLGTLLALSACASVRRPMDTVMAVKADACVRVHRESPTRRYPRFTGSSADEAALRELLKAECIVGITAMSDNDFGRECRSGSQDECFDVLPIFNDGRPKKQTAVVEIHFHFDDKTGMGEGALILVEKTDGKWRVRERVRFSISTIS